MFVTTAIEPATSLVSAQMRPTIVPTTSTATIAASQYRIRRLVMRRSLLSWGFRRSFRQALLVGAPHDNLPAEQGLKAGGVSTKGQGPLAYRCSSEVLNRHRERHVLRMATWKPTSLPTTFRVMLPSRLPSQLVTSPKDVPRKGAADLVNAIYVPPGRAVRMCAARSTKRGWGGPRSRGGRDSSHPRRGRRPRACRRSSCRRRPCRSDRGPKG